MEGEAAQQLGGHREGGRVATERRRRKLAFQTNKGESEGGVVSPSAGYPVASCFLSGRDGGES